MNENLRNELLDDIISTTNGMNELVKEAINSKNDHELKSIFVGIGHQIGFLSSSVQNLMKISDISDKEDAFNIGFKNN